MFKNPIEILTELWERTIQLSSKLHERHKAYLLISYDIGDAIDVGQVLHHFYEQVKKKVIDYRTKYPLLADYLNSKMKTLEELYKVYEEGGTLDYRRVKAANLYEYCHGLELELLAMDGNDFPFLYDSRLWRPLRNAMNENKLPITEKWAKVVIAANLLELVINYTLQKLDSTKYEKLNADKAGLERRFNELNSLLVAKNLEKHKLNKLKFDELRAVRNIGDHPDPETIGQIEDDHVKRTVEYVHYALNELKQVDSELASRNKQHTKYDKIPPPERPVKFELG